MNDDEETMRGPNKGVNCSNCGCRLPFDYVDECPDCGVSVLDISEILAALGGE